MVRDWRLELGVWYHMHIGSVECCIGECADAQFPRYILVENEYI